MDKMRMESVDMTAQNIEKIGALFPNCITETIDENGKAKKAINFELLKQMLSGDVIEGSEAYEFTWVGKKAAIVEANKPIRKTLRPCKEESVNWDTTENLYIEGDNLEVLKLLQESYLGAIKMIYIDPPYNTGNDFIYRDDFKQDMEGYEEDLGVYDNDGNRMFKNTDANGRFHSDWCSMIYSRLLLARNLLCDDGVIFISIDDNELENLKKICDDVFGESNFINIISLKTKDSSGASGGGEDRRLKKNIEFVLCYAKEGFIRFNELYRPVKIGQYMAEMEASKTSFKYTTVFTDLGTKEFVKTIKDGSGQDMQIYRHIGYQTKSLKKVAEEEKCSIVDVFYKYLDRICTTENAQTSIRTRVKDATVGDDSLFSVDYIPVSGRNKGKLTTIYFIGEQKRLVSWFSVLCVQENGVIYKKEKIGTFWDGFNWNNVSREGNVPYPNGKKAVAFLEQLCNAVTSQNENDIILDFFSGSASTAHAVINCNNKDQGNRHFIMVQLPEKPDLSSVEYDFPVDTICDIGKERIRRAGAKIKEENPLMAQNLDTGFRVLKLDDTNMTDVYYSADEYSQDMLSLFESNVKADRTDLDLLFGCLLEWGLPLSLPYTSETIGKFTVHTYNDGDLVACFNEDVSEGVVKEIARKKPLRAVFRDSSFSNSASKINVFEIFKMISPETSVKVI